MKTFTIKQLCEMTDVKELTEAKESLIENGIHAFADNQSDKWFRVDHIPNMIKFFINNIDKRIK